jgi:hypothetical protein
LRVLVMSQQLHPMIKSQLSLLAAETEHEIVKLNMRRDSIKSLQPQSGAARMRLTEQAFELHKIAAGYRYLLSIVEQGEPT